MSISGLDDVTASEDPVYVLASYLRELFRRESALATTLVAACARHVTLPLEGAVYLIVDRLHHIEETDLPTRDTSTTTFLSDEDILTACRDALRCESTATSFAGALLTYAGLRRAVLATIERLQTGDDPRNPW